MTKVSIRRNLESYESNKQPCTSMWNGKKLYFFDEVSIWLDNFGVKYTNSENIIGKSKIF